METRELLRELARARELVTGDDAYMKRIEAQIAETQLGRDLAHVREVREIDRQRVAELENQLRNEALAEYTLTNTKSNLCEGACGVREDVTLAYEEKAAVGWARYEMPSLLTVDAKRFERQMKDNLGHGYNVPDFVTWTRVPKATIAVDLSKWLEV